MPNLAEHKAIGDSLNLKGLDFNQGKLKLKNGLNVTFGDIAGIAGDFIAPESLKVVSKGENDKEKQEYFLSAYNNIAQNPKYIEFVKEMVQEANKELNEIKKAKEKGLSAEKYYTSSSGRDWKWMEICDRHGVQAYLDMASHNVDHFDSSALICYTKI